MIVNKDEEIVPEKQDNRVAWINTIYSKIGPDLLALVIVCSLVYFVTGYLHYKQSWPLGDEPHYLVITQTLLTYHSLDVMRDYRNKDWSSFYQGHLDPHIVSNRWGQPLPLHGIGGPVLWLIPFALFGRKGAIGLNILVSIAIIITISLFLKALDIRKGYAFLVSVAFALGSQIYIYSSLTFIEPMAALMCISVMRVLFQRKQTMFDLVGASLALGILPWLHIRFAQIELVLFVFLLLRLYREHKYSNVKVYVAYLVPVLLLFLLLEAYSLLIWGSLNPAANEITSGNVPFHDWPFIGLLGITFDQEFGLFTNFPFMMFALPGVLLALKKRYATLNGLMFLLFVPYVLVFTTFKDWAGGMCPPGRYILILTPLLSFYVAYALQQAKSRILNSICLLLLLFAFACAMAYVGARGYGFNHGGGQNFAMQHLGLILHLNFSGYVPSVVRHGQKRLFVAWFAGCMGLMLVTLFLAKRGSWGEHLRRKTKCEIAPNALFSRK